MARVGDEPFAAVALSIHCLAVPLQTATTHSADVTASLDDHRWLTDEAARPWLARASDELAAGAPLVPMMARLRKDLSPERAHLVLSQVELRQRAQEKFSRAAEMFFTPLGLAQATDELLARYKAARLGAEQSVADLCCGIGGDLIAIGEGRRCLGVDRDPIAAHLAAVNAGVYGVSGLTIACEEASARALQSRSAWHIDPDRRPEGKRTVRAERFEPPWEVIEELLARCGDAAVKLAPATKLSAEVAARCEREWIESRGECRQQVAWWGGLARHAGHCAATVIDTAGGTATIVGAGGEPAPLAESIGRYVYEPCAAVRAARLVGIFCQQAGFESLGSVPSYLTSDRRISLPLAAGFEVLDSLPFDLRRLKDALRQLGIGPVEVKKRGVAVDPDRLRRQMGRSEGEPGVVLIAPVGVRTMAIVARRLVRPT